MWKESCKVIVWSFLLTGDSPASERIGGSKPRLRMPHNRPRGNVKKILKTETTLNAAESLRPFQKFLQITNSITLRILIQK